jgi:protein SCO1/2
MDRRSYLRAAGIGVAAGTAGCVGGVGFAGSRNPNVTLPEPDRPFDSEDVSYPAWGQQVPDVTVLDAFSGEPIALRGIEGPRYHTFFFANCMTLCPVLESRLRELQIHAVENGYADGVGFYPITFDPERDTPERLRREAEEMNVDLSAGNWHYLRPESPARAKEVITGAFGIGFQRTEATEETNGKYMFNHIGMITLVNGDGYVERAYRISQTDLPSENAMIEDLRTVRNGGSGGLF